MVSYQIQSHCYRRLRNLAFPKPQPKTTQINSKSALNPGGERKNLLNRGRKEHSFQYKIQSAVETRNYPLRVKKVKVIVDENVVIVVMSSVTYIYLSIYLLETCFKVRGIGHMISSCIMVSTTLKGHVLALTESSPENITPE